MLNQGSQNSIESQARQPLLSSSHGRNQSSTFKGVVAEERSYHDIFFGILFLAMFGAMIFISSIGFSKGDPSMLIPSNSTEEQTEHWLQDAVAQTKEDRFVLAGSLCLAVALAFIWVQLMKKFTKLFIYLTFILGISLIAILAFYFLSLGIQRNDTSLQILSYCVFGLAAILLIVVLFLRKKIALTSLLFKECCQGVECNPGLFLVALIVVCLYAIFCAFWITALVYLYSVPSDSNESDQASNQFNVNIRYLIYYQVFGFFWTASFLSAIFQVSVAGSISIWYFSRDIHGYSSDVGYPAFKSFGRALTKSFGSLALGSLILSTVQFVSFLISQVKRLNKTNKIARCVLCCFQCVFGCMEGIIKFVNRFAYVYIAIYGDSFCQSARKCYDLISRNLFTVAVVDTLGEFVLIIGRLIGTSASTLLCVSILHGLGRDIAPTTLVLVIVISYSVFTIVSHIIGVGIDAVFVSYMIDLEKNGTEHLYISPELHKMLQTKSVADKNVIQA